MRISLVIFVSLFIFGCSTAHKSSSQNKNTTEQNISKKQQLEELVDKIKICFTREGSTSPGGPCYSGPGGVRSRSPGGACYSGPGGALYSGPGGNLYSGPGGNRYAGPGGTCYSGPGGNCANGMESASCPEICGHCMAKSKK